MISQTEQDEIISTIRTLANPEMPRRKYEERVQLLFTGALVALGVANVPPAWYMNISAGRADRIVHDYELRTTTSD